MKNIDLSPTEEELDFASKSRPTPIENSNFTESSEGLTDDELSFAEQSKSQPRKQSTSFLESEKNAATRGLIRAGRHATQTVRQAVAPGGLEEGLASFLLPEKQKKDIEKNLQPLSLGEEQQQEEELKQKFPTQPGRASEYTEKAAELIPTAILGREGWVGKTLRTGAATALSTEAKKAGYGEGVQNTAEILAYGFPDLRRFIPSANQRQQVVFDFMRSMGMTEEQIAPLAVGENWFSRSLMRYAKRTGNMEHSLRDTQRGLGQIYDQLALSPQAQQVLSPQQRQNFLNHAANTVHNLPHNLRMEIFQDAADLVQGPMNGQRMMNFYQDIGDTIQRLEGPRSRRLVGVQNDVIDGIASASPQLAEEIRLTNGLYQRYNTLRERMRPRQFENLIESAKAIGALTYLVTGDYEGAAVLIGISQAKAATSRFLTNPRFRNLQQRFIHAMNNNSIPLANSILKEFSQEFKEDVPEFAEELSREEIKANPKKSTQ